MSPVQQRKDRLGRQIRRHADAPAAVSPWQLVIHDSAEMAEMVMHTVETKLRALAYPQRLRHARNIGAADRHIESEGLGSCSVIVVGSATPQDDSSSVALAGREPMQRFVERLKGARPDLPVVVVAATPDDRLASFLEQFQPTALVKMDSQFSTELGRRVGVFHGEKPTEAAARMGRLRFDLHLHGRQGSWEISRSGDDPFVHQGDLYIDNDLLERVLFLSHELERRILTDHLLGHVSDGGWLKALKFLSQDLNRLIFDGSVPNINCWETFLKHRERAGGIERARIHVTVDSETHPLLVEAFRDRGASDPEYWMLRAPVLRRYRHSAQRKPLFKDPEHRGDPINCLIVEADPRGGNLPDYGAEFKPLPHCAMEAAAIAKVLKKAGFRVAARPSPGGEAEQPPGCYEHLRLATVRGDLRDAIALKLKERTWHVIHFCGHVVAHQDKPPGLVLVPEPGGVMPISALAAQLSGSQFVFLSSCRSASAKVVLQAVEQHVPAVLGYQWIVDDHDAARFAKEFYEALFDRGSVGFRYLEYAFLQARRAVYERDPHTPSWVAPALVMQME